MAGIQNNIEFAGGFKLQASSSRDISDMQTNPTDVSNINHTGSPEGVISANPSSLCHDPISGNIYVKSTGTGNTGWQIIGGGTSPIKITTYNVADSPGIWTKTANCQVVEGYIFAGGAGGGSGRKGLTTQSGGGGGGQPGQLIYFKSPASTFGTTESFTVGAGGTGAAAQTTDNTNGNNGTDGENSTFGDYIAFGGSHGTGGINGFSFPAASFPALILYVSSTSSSSGGGSNTNGTNGDNAGGSANSAFIPTGSGGGGGANAASATSGGNGGIQYYSDGTTIFLAAGVGGSELGPSVDGSAGSNASSSSGLIGGGTGGGGGGGYSTGALGNTTGGSGGAGGSPGGPGGGGGAGISAIANSGAGGDGADGKIIIIEYF